MSNLRDPRLIYLKGALFLLGGCLSAGLILLEMPSWRVALLLGIALWCCCRAYYFAFYVVEHYVDPGYRFAGLASFLRYLWRQRCEGRNSRAA